MLVTEWFCRSDWSVGGARCFYELDYARLLCGRSVEKSEDFHGRSTAVRNTSYGSVLIADSEKL